MAPMAKYHSNYDAHQTLIDNVHHTNTVYFLPAAQQCNLSCPTHFPHGATPVMKTVWCSASHFIYYRPYKRDSMYPGFRSEVRHDLTPLWGAWFVQIFPISGRAETEGVFIDVFGHVFSEAFPKTYEARIGLLSLSSILALSASMASLVSATSSLMVARFDVDLPKGPLLGVDADNGLMSESEGVRSAPGWYSGL